MTESELDSDSEGVTITKKVKVILKGKVKVPRSMIRKHSHFPGFPALMTESELNNKGESENEHDNQK